MNAISAVTHRDPYPYYKSLVDGPPLVFDEQLQLWIAACATSVAEVLTSHDCRVRPIGEPVPATLEGQPAGEIFARLVRMSDGISHGPPKIALERTLAAMPASAVATRTRHLAIHGVPASCLDPETLTAWTYDVPVAVVSSLLGFSADEQSLIVKWTREFVACLSPLSTPEQLSKASAAASHLRSRIYSLLKSIDPSSDNLISRLQYYGADVGWDDTASIVANLVGLLSQTCDATAGLISNSIVALATQPRLLGEVRGLANGWDQLVHETSRYDSPVQNTRRFVVEPTTIGGIPLVPGAIVLLVLAAANRDPHTNHDPETFRLQRLDRCVFSFSRGAHACPGEALARTIAAAALSVLFNSMPDSALAKLSWTYSPSTNGRLPAFQYPNCIAQS